MICKNANKLNVTEKVEEKNNQVRSEKHAKKLEKKVIFLIEV